MMLFGMFLWSAICVFGVMHRTEALRLSEAAVPRPLAKPALITGTVVFELEVNTAGAVTKTALIQGHVPFIEQSREAVKEWVFTPISDHSSPTRLSATFVYKARPDLPDKPSAFNLSIPDTAIGRDAALPVRIVEPSYPIGGLGDGIVILQADVDPLGNVLRVGVVRPIPFLTDSAVAAVCHWRFSSLQAAAAKVQERPRTAIVVLSFQRPKYAK
jgi:hypothetical protein